MSAKGNDAVQQREADYMMIRFSAQLTIVCTGDARICR